MSLQDKQGERPGTPEKRELLEPIRPAADLAYSWEEPAGSPPERKSWRKRLPAMLVTGGLLAAVLVTVLVLALSGDSPAPVEDPSSLSEETAGENTSAPAPENQLQKVGSVYFNTYYVFEDPATGLRGVADTRDQVAVEAQYDRIDFLNLERLLVTRENAMGVVDLENREVYPLGEQVIQFEKGPNGQSQPLLIVQKGTQTFLIDLNGQTVGESWESLRFDIYGNLQGVRDGETLTLNWQGQPSGGSIPGDAMVEAARDGESLIFQSGGLYGIADLNRQVLVPASYECMTELASGRFLVRNAAGWGIIDRQGSAVVPVEQDALTVLPAGDGTADGRAITQRGGVYRLLDTQTGLPLNGESWDYMEADPLSGAEGSEQWIYAVQGSREVLLDLDGRELTQKPGDLYSLGAGSLVNSRSDLSVTVRLVGGERLYGLQDAEGAQLIPAEYQELYIVSRNRVLTRQDTGGGSQYRMYDYAGKLVSDRVYEEVSYRNLYELVPSEEPEDGIGTASYRENGRIRQVIIDEDFEPVSGPYDRIDWKDQVCVCWLDGVSKTIPWDSLYH